MEVYFYEAFQEEAVHLKTFLPGEIEAGYDWRSIQESGHTVPPARLISIRTQSVLPVDWCGRLDGVLTRSTGYDHVAAWIGECGSPPAAGYLPLYCHRSVAEQALLLWLALERRLPAQLCQFETFRRDGLTGSECMGRTLLVVGVGNIGHELARIGRGLDMKVLGVDIVHRHRDISYIDISRGIRRADIIVCAMSLNRTNYHYFSRPLWSMAKPGALFVNIARGEMAAAADLLWALERGYLRGAALDVYEDEPDLAGMLRAGKREDAPHWPALDRLRKRDDVILTPHNAFNTKEAVERKSRQSAGQIACFLKHGRFKWPVRPTD